MSWSVSIIGTKDAVAKKAAEAFDAAAKNYAGQEEELVALLEQGSVYGNGVSVEANGSRSTGYVSMNVAVKAVVLALDEPAAAS
jgi:hypothetical protein